MDILKLAAEMDLTCIKAYKIDALKSVYKTNETMYSGITEAKIEDLDVTVVDPNSSSFPADEKICIDMATCSINASPSLPGKS